MFLSLGIAINAISILILYIVSAYLIHEYMFVRIRLETNQTQMDNLINDINYNDKVLNSLVKETFRPH